MKKILLTLIVSLVCASNAHALLADKGTFEVKNLLEIAPLFVQFESIDDQTVTLSCHYTVMGSSVGVNVGQDTVFIKDPIASARGYCSHNFYKFVDAIVAGAKATVTYDVTAGKISLNTSAK